MVRSGNQQREILAAAWYSGQSSPREQVDKNWFLPQKQYKGNAGEETEENN
jgi:hypothetical protein